MLNRYYFFNFRHFLFEHPLNTLLEGYFSAGSPTAGSFKANFYQTVFSNFHKLNIAAVSLKKGSHFS